MRFCKRCAQQCGRFLAVAGAEKAADLRAFAAEAQKQAPDEIALLILLQLDLDPVAGEVQLFALLVAVEPPQDELMRGDLDLLFFERVIIVLAERPPNETDVRTEKGRDGPGAEQIKCSSGREIEGDEDGHQNDEACPVKRAIGPQGGAKSLVCAGVHHLILAAS